MNKKLLLGLLVFVVSMANLKAQRHELGVRFGTSSMVGDIGRTSYLLQAPLDFDRVADYGLPLYGGLIYRMNFNPHQTLRFDLGYSHIQFDDKVAKEEYRRNRQMWGTNNLLEADAIFEYNFFPVNNEQQYGMVSPYIFAGIGAMMHDVTQATLNHDFRRDADGVAQAPVNELDYNTTVAYETGRKVTAFIPFGIGLKYKFNYNWAISGEMMFRTTFTDQLDYSTISAKDVKSTFNADILAPNTNTSLLQTDVYYAVSKEREREFINSRTVGDPNGNDWVNSVTIGVTYSFGRPPCYCD
ncbi:DUF6089 family protein [Chryseobacterium sp. MFBS3-17]|uniref:DUF6089 family protein n=1 Tax=Chryseobacterium sp. MFBS3-17 TaxID=2886689 RepID=UPI001D0E9EC4|nr:DUF6089 family protein [Chryseobacterium sp. MFBS3-17]MCC2591342.1 DUF6089 family protein [Chryseobacterium sp. MFBS3-17]